MYVVIEDNGPRFLVVVVKSEIDSFGHNRRGLHFKGLVRIRVLFFELIHKQCQVVRRIAFIGPEVEHSFLKEDLSEFQIGSEKISIV